MLYHITRKIAGHRPHTLRPADFFNQGLEAETMLSVGPLWIHHISGGSPLSIDLSEWIKPLPGPRRRTLEPGESLLLLAHDATNTRLSSQLRLHLHGTADLLYRLILSATNRRESNGQDQSTRRR